MDWRLRVQVLPGAPQTSIPAPRRVHTRQAHSLSGFFYTPTQPAHRWLFSWSNVMAEKLSTVQKRENAGYQETPSTCSKCAHFQSEKELPAWMRADNEKMASLGRNPIYSIASSGIDRKLKCSIHGFSVKKMAVCSSFLDRG